ESCLLDQFTEQQRRKGCLFGRLKHNGATGSQSRPQFPSSHQQRKVPRNNLAYDADRFPQSVGEIVRTKLTSREGLSFNLSRPARHVAEEIDGQGYVCHPG